MFMTLEEEEMDCLEEIPITDISATYLSDEQQIVS